MAALYHHDGTGIMMTMDQHQAAHHQMTDLPKKKKENIFKILQSVAARIYNFQF